MSADRIAAAATARRAGVHLLHLRQHGQAEGRHAHARNVRLDGRQRRRRSRHHADDVFLPATSASHIAALVALVRRAGGRGTRRDGAQRSAPTNCCRCFAARGRRCCACCPRRCSAWCAITARRATISDRSAAASPAATRSPAELEHEFTALDRLRDRGAVRHDRNRHRHVSTRPRPAIGSARSASSCPGFTASIRDDARRGSARRARPAGCGSSRPAT